MAAVLLWLAWLASGSYQLVSLLGAGTILATFQFVMTALPLRYGEGFAPEGMLGAESDGRTVVRILTGAPPTIDVELRQAFDEPESATRPVFLVLLLLAALLSLFVHASLALELAAVVSAAILLRR